MTLIGQDAGWEKTEKRKNTANKEKRKPTLACACIKHGQKRNPAICSFLIKKENRVTNFRIYLSNMS
jgi:hypothetical protein